MSKLRMLVDTHDLADLQASGLTDATIRSNGLRTITNPSEIMRLLNRKPEQSEGKTQWLYKGGGLGFPYRGLDGKLTGFYRIKPRTPRIVEGKPVRYESPKGSTLHAYFPVTSLPLLLDGTSDVFLAEGEKKTLALAQLGVAAVGIGGIWCGCKPKTTELIDDLAEIQLTGRVVYIVFDYDVKESVRNESEAAKRRLANACYVAGAAEVRSVLLPPGPDGGKNGIDDYLLSRGKIARSEFESLLSKAIIIIKIIPNHATGIDSNKIISIIPPLLAEPAFHGPIGRFLKAVGEFTEATDAGVLAHLLPAIGGYIGRGPHIYAGSEQPARINTVLVGPTSTGRKGTSFVPVDLLMREVDPTFWNDQRVGGLSTGEGLIAQVADRTRKDEEGNQIPIFVEKRLYVVEEEFSKVLAQLRRDGNILSQILRESYDSGDLFVMTRSNPLKATGAHISITGHITPEELTDRFNHIEMANGFGNRFLWFAVRSEKVMPQCQRIPPSGIAPLAKIVKQLGSSGKRQVALASACMRRWESEIYQRLREDRPGLAGALCARGTSMVLRIALIYYLIDNPTQGGSQVLASKHLDAALAVWRYCEESVNLLFPGKSGSPLPDKILSLLSEGQQSRDSLNDHLSASQKSALGQVLERLEAEGKIGKTVIKKPGPGRPSTFWHLVE